MGAARADDDDVGAVDGRRQHGRHQLGTGEARVEPFDVDTAALADLDEPGVVQVV